MFIHGKDIAHMSTKSLIDVFDQIIKIRPYIIGIFEQLGLDWRSAESKFCEFLSFKHSAGFHLPVLMQIIISKNDAYMLTAIFDLISGDKAQIYDSKKIPKINYCGDLARVVREDEIKEIPGKVPGYFVIYTQGDDDPIDPLDVSYHEKAIAEFIPQREWWVTPFTDLQAFANDIQELCNRLGLFYYCQYPQRLCLVKFSTNEYLRKPTIFDASGYAGFWPSIEEWGRTVRIDSFDGGVREAIQEFKSSLGSTRLYIYGTPESKIVNWEVYCYTRITLLLSFCSD
jgi:hypothetical protein